MGVIDINFQKPNVLRPVPDLRNQYSFFSVPSFSNTLPTLEEQSKEMWKLRPSMSDVSLIDNTRNNTTTLVAARTAGAATDYLSGLDKLFGESELGRLMGNIFSSGLSSAGNTVIDNLIKGESFFKGVGVNAGRSIAGAGAGLALNLIGQGISSLGGNSMLSRGVGQAVSTGLGSVGGLLTTTGKLTFQGKNLFSNVEAGVINPYTLGASAIGSGLSAALGPSKEYNGRYGAITKTMDTIYDGAMSTAGFVPGIGQGISGVMALNKGLSNLFGSTDGMCVCAGTKIFTASGDIINIEDLLLEQGIIGWDENSHNILPNTIAGIIEPRLKECLEIELKNGTVLRCSIDHPILSNIKEKAESHRINGKRIAYREWSFRRADELQVGNWIGLANNIDYWGTEEMPNAYLVGMLIGDGTYTYESSCKLWTADPSTWKYLEENNLAILIGQYTPENSNGKYSIENRDYCIINGMQLVKDLGIAYLKGQEKTLPKNIGKYNKDSICKLIAGLYDTDGSFSVNEEKGDYKITLYQSNLELLENLKLILQKLGIFATIYTRKASINKMSNGRIINSNQSYRLELTDRNSIINFYKNIPLNIDYKKEHLEKIYKLVFPKLDKDHCDLSGAKQYKIVSIKHIGIQTVYNLEASETHTYLANGIITHNTKTDAILGSAFMPAPVKWLNMLGSSKTGNFYNQSWLNSEKADTFMQNAFGNLGDKFNLARKEAGKRYGTFSQGAKRRALDNLDFANYAWDRILAMADLNELLNIRSLYMTSINNLRYAQMIQGGWSPLAIGKQGMKIFNNATNHNMGMRLLSAAALIDNKQMILSFLGGGTPRHLKYKKPTGGAKKFRALTQEELENRTPKIIVTPVIQRTPEELNEEWERTHPNGGNADPNLSRVSDLTSEVFNLTIKPPFTGQEYQQAIEEQRLKKLDKFYEAEKIGEAAMMADLAVSAAPLLLRGFRWAFNKAGLLVKVPKLIELSAPEIPIDVSNYTGKWKNWVERIQPKLTNKSYDSQKLISIGDASKDKAFLYYKSDEFVKRAKNAGFNDSEISLLQKELLDMLSHSLVKSSSSSNNGVHAWADAYLDKSGNLYRNATSFEPNVQGFSLEDIIGMWDHEFGHVATNMYNSAGRNLGNFMQLVESRYPMIVKMMKYNESIAPKFKSELENLYNFWHSSDIKTKLKQSYPELSELELKEFINKYLKFSENIKEYIGNSNELRSRALSTLFAALRKGKSAYLYILENSENLNAARELGNIFESQSLKKYLDNFLNYSVPITTVGGTAYASTKQ